MQLTPKSTLNSPVAPPSSGDSRRGGRPKSIFGSLKSPRFTEDNDSSGRATESKGVQTRLFAGKDSDGKENRIDLARNRTVLLRGKAQTNSRMFWKKRQYLVLSETHLVRFKSQSRAAEIFPTIPSSSGRAGPSRHSSSHSIDSGKDVRSLTPAASTEDATAIPLEHIVAVYVPDDPRLTHTLEVFSFDKELGAQGSSITLHLNDAESRDLWLQALREAANRARLSDADPVPHQLSEYVARVLESEQDYDVTKYRIYKVVRLSAPRPDNRSTIEDSVKVPPTLCFLVVGIHRVHLVALPKNDWRQSTPALTEGSDGNSFGILTVKRISVSALDDCFVLVFRPPFHKPQVLHLASLAASEVALQLCHADAFLRPQWLHRPFMISVPAIVKDDFNPEENAHAEDLKCFDRTLTAFCVAYNVNPSSIKYSVHYDVEDAPRFQLLPPNFQHPRRDSALRLLAVMRSLRYNDSFSSLSFSGTALGALAELNDPHGLENICMTGKNPVLPLSEVPNMSLLVQEVRALAIGNKRLRRLDFSFCMQNGGQPGRPKLAPENSGLVEAIAPLCKNQTTNADWIVLDGNGLGEVDVGYLISLAADRKCHLRGIEIHRCGLSDRDLWLLLDALRDQRNTLEALNISNNMLRLESPKLSEHLNPFRCIRILDLSNLPVADSNEAFLPFSTLALWRLEVLRLAGISLNTEQLGALRKYLAHSQSRLLFDLNLTECCLFGNDVASLMQSMVQESGMARYLHLDVSENHLQEEHDDLVSAIARGMAPTHLSMRCIEYVLDDIFGEVLLGFATNKSIRFLDISGVILPAAASERTCNALGEIFAQNQTLEELNVSGESTRLEVSTLGVGINQALERLKQNTTLQILRLQHQNLGPRGADTLADVLKENTCLRELHCESNAIPLSGFTNLADALVNNFTILHLPCLDEDRDAVLQWTKQQTAASQIGSMGRPSHAISTMRRTLTKSLTESPNGSKSGSGRIDAAPQLTKQELQDALKVISEEWQVQADRILKLLDRNWHVANGVSLEEAEGIAGTRGAEEAGRGLGNTESEGL